MGPSCLWAIRENKFSGGISTKYKPMILPEWFVLFTPVCYPELHYGNAKSRAAIKGIKKLSHPFKGSGVYRNPLRGRIVE